MSRIKVFVMDVDGTLTDGKIYMGNQGEVCKAFDVKDGYGVHEILPQNGVTTVIMTGRNSEIVNNRAKELEISIVLQNVKEKGNAIECLKEQLQCEYSEIAYVGDDIIDIPAMLKCGFAACPIDAVKEVKEICQYVSSCKGGYGAVRDIIDFLKEREFVWGNCE